MKTTLIDQLKSFTQNVSTENNVLTQEEKQTLMMLLRKSVAPSAAYVNSSNEDEAEESITFANAESDDFGDEGANKLGELCSDIVGLLSDLISDELAPVLKASGLEDPTDEMIKTAIDNVNKNNGLPTSFLSKPVLLGAFLIQSIEEPLVAILNGYNCFEVGEKVCTDAIRISAIKVHAKVAQA